MGAAIGFWVALSLAVPASLRPINLNLQVPPPRPAATQAPKTLPPSFFTTQIPKPPPAPTWVRAMFGDPDHPPSGGNGRGAHGGSHGFGHGFGGGHGHGGGCHGGGHR